MELKPDIWASNAELSANFRTQHPPPQDDAAMDDVEYMLVPWAPVEREVLMPGGAAMSVTEFVIKTNHDVNFFVKFGPRLAEVDWSFSATLPCRDTKESKAR